MYSKTYGTRSVEHRQTAMNQQRKKKKRKRLWNTNPIPLATNSAPDKVGRSWRETQNGPNKRGYLANTLAYRWGVEVIRIWRGSRREDVVTHNGKDVYVTWGTSSSTWDIDINNTEESTRRLICMRRNGIFFSLSLFFFFLSRVRGNVL